jgi:hypothetical protein
MRATPLSLALAAPVAAGSTFFAATVFAADCPANKVGSDVTKPGPTKPEGVTDTVIASIDLSPIGSGLSGRKMRMRKLVVRPGGIVPWHSHEARPANIYIVSGSITEADILPPDMNPDESM